jgi:hypothetical protein
MGGVPNESFYPCFYAFWSTRTVGRDRSCIGATRYREIDGLDEHTNIQFDRYDLVLTDKKRTHDARMPLGSKSMKKWTHASKLKAEHQIH